MTNTPRALITEWWRTEIDGAESIDLSEATQRAVTHFRHDRAFCKAFLDAFLYATIKEVGSGLLASARHETIQQMHQPAAVIRVPASQITQAIRPVKTNWQRWMEYDPISGQHISLMKMTKEQALAAAEHRESQADTQYHRAAMLRLAAGRLSTGQTIEDAWLEDELVDIERSIELDRPQLTLRRNGKKLSIMGQIQADQGAA